MIIGVISNIIHHNNSWKQLAAVERASDQKFFRLENLQIAWKWIHVENFDFSLEIGFDFPQFNVYVVSCRDC